MSRLRLLLAGVLLTHLGCGPRPPRELDEPPAELGEKLRSGGVNTRRDAAFTLSRLAVKGDRGAEVAKPALREALRDADYVTRVFAAHSLATMGDADDGVRQVYEEAITHPDVWARVQACCGVRKNPALLAASLPILDRGLSDPDDTVVWEAAQSLAKCIVLDQWPILDKLLKVARRAQHSPPLQQEALRALGKADPKHARRVLEEVRTVDCHGSQYLDVERVKEQTIAALTRTLNGKAEK